MDKLKIGILLNNYMVPAWKYKVLERIIHSEYGGIKLLIWYESYISAAKKEKKSIGYVILRFHERLDKLIFKNKSDYSRQIDSADLLKDIDVVLLKPEEKESHEIYCAKALEEIRKYDLDIIVNFGAGIIKGDILKIPKYGVWSYRLGDNPAINKIATGYKEVVSKNPVTRSVLEILNEDQDKGTIIFSSWESTYGYSINVNRNKVFWRASLFIPRIMNGIYHYGNSYLTSLINKNYNMVNADIPDPFIAPSFIQSLCNFLFFLTATIRQSFKKILFTDSFNWMLFYEIKQDGNRIHNSFSSYTKLKSARDKFWADPFVISKDNKYYIFVEELVYKTNKGHISVIELNSAGNFLGSEKIIDKPYHLSYPFIFDFCGSYYMIPESSENKAIELYKCKNFPNNWEFIKNMMENLSAVDTTVFFHNNKWWLFTSIDETDNVSGGSTELFLFFSDDVFTDKWISHPCNPIISDSRTARPAGRIFVQDNKIYRPSQDCTVRYGKGFNINQIILLTETEYEEKLIMKVGPDWNKRLKGTHTFNYDKDFTVIDAYEYRSRIGF